MVRRTRLILYEIIAGLLTGIVALGGLGAWRLHAGPIPLDFLTPHLEEALKSEGRGYSVQIDRTVAVWAGWHNAIDIVARGVVVTAPDGSTLARVPRLSLGLSVRALVRGHLAPTSLDAIAPNVRVVRQENGEFALGFVGGTEDQPTAPQEPSAEPEVAASTEVINFLVDELLAEPDPSRSFGYLRRVSIEDGQVVFVDRMAGKVYRAPDAQIELLKSNAGITAKAQLKLTYGDRQANFTINSGIGKRDLAYFTSLKFSELQPAAFASSLPSQLSSITALRLPLSGSVDLHGHLRGKVESFDFNLLGGAGKLELTDLYREPLPVKSLRLQGSAAADFSNMRFDQAVVDLGDVTAYVSGSLKAVGDNGGMQASLSAHAENFDMHELHRFWPVSAEPKAREWVTQNIFEGTVDKGTINLALSIGGGDEHGVKLDSLGGTFAFTGLGIHYFEKMTPVVGIDGRGTFDQHAFHFTVDRASLASDIKLTDAKVDILNLGEKGKTRLYVDAKAGGPVATALKVLDEDPLNYGEKLGFNATQLGGDTKFDLHFELPLVKHITGDMLEVEANAKLSDVTVPHGPFNLAIDGGAFDLSVTRAAMAMNGAVRLNGVPADVSWKENFDKGARFKSRFNVKASPNSDQRRLLGLPNLSYWLEGTVPTNLTYTIPEKGPAQLSVRSDLTPALVRLPEAAWQKDPGRSGRLEIDARVLPKGGMVMDRLHVKTGDADGTVKIEFLPDMSDIARVTLRDVRYRGNDVKGSITRMATGGYRVVLHGDRVDVRHFLNDDYEKLRAKAEAAEGGPKGPGKPLTIKADFKQIVTGEGRRMHNGHFNGVYDGKNWAAVLLQSTLGQGGELKVSYGKGDNGYELLVRSDDAGQALQSLNWWDEVQGGSMVIEGRRKTIDGPLTGNVWVKDFRMRQAPAGIKLLQIITVVGLPAAAAAGDGISFAGLEGSYTYDNGVLTLGETEAWGPVGVHVDSGGMMDFNKNRISMQGVVVPANTLQKVLGFIPFLGLILGDGLIAANFSVTGALDHPTVHGSTASVFLPGFLRKLFRLKPDDETGDKPGAEPPIKRD